MKKIIDRICIFWSKLTACFRFLRESKTTNWVIFYDEVNKETGEKTMTYQAEKTANMGDVYNLVYAGYSQTAKIVFNALDKSNMNVLEILKNDTEKVKVITEFFNAINNLQKTNSSPLKKMSNKSK